MPLCAICFNTGKPNPTTFDKNRIMQYGYTCDRCGRSARQEEKDLDAGFYEGEARVICTVE